MLRRLERGDDFFFQKLCLRERRRRECSNHVNGFVFVDDQEIDFLEMNKRKKKVSVFRNVSEYLLWTIGKRCAWIWERMNTYLERRNRHGRGRRDVQNRKRPDCVCQSNRIRNLSHGNLHL